MENPHDLAALCGTLSRETGLAFDGVGFESRLRIQKTVYLVQEGLGRPLAVAYRFNNYLRGPYSPDLALAYYADDFHERAQRPGPPSVDPSELRVLSEAVRKGNDFLEAVTSIHFLWRTEPEATPFAITEKVAALKSHLERPLLGAAWSFLTRHPLIAKPAETHGP